VLLYTSRKLGMALRNMVHTVLYCRYTIYKLAILC